MVARTPGGREVASSSLVSLTTNLFMNFIYSLLADANHSLPDGDVFMHDVVAPAEIFFSKYFNIDWKINAIFTTSLPWLVIPEDKVGGKTYASDFVALAVNKDTSAHKASEMLIHELAHAIRWGKNPEWSNNLFCELVNEGLAVHIEARFANGFLEYYS